MCMTEHVVVVVVVVATHACTHERLKRISFKFGLPSFNIATTTEWSLDSVRVDSRQKE